MPSIMTQVDRIVELSRLLHQMCSEYDYKKFCKLQEKWDDLVAIYRLEDELNADHDSTVI